MIDTLSPVAPIRRARRNPRWDYAGGLAGRASVVQSRNVNLLLYARAFMWFHEAAHFRNAERQLLYRQKAGSSLRVQHRQVIEALIEQGRELVRRIHAGGGLIKPANGFSVQDLQSAIAELENTQLQWHGGMAKRRKAEILKDVFDVA